MALPPTVAAQLSSDASLRSLSVDSTVAQTKMTPAFDPEVTNYFVAAPSEGDMVTVNFLINHRGATLGWIGDDADPNLPGHQLAVTAGDTTSVSIRVDAEDEETYRWYGITVARASNDEKGWRVYDDVLVDEVVDDPKLPSHYLRGLWADDTRILTTGWRYDPFDQKLFAFNVDGSRRPADEFVLGGKPDAGIWSDGTTLWAMDSDGSLRAYNLSSGSEVEGLSTDVSPNGYYDTSDVEAPRGIWSDGETLWVVDHDNTEVFAFVLPTDPEDCSRSDNYCRQSLKDFDLSDGNDDPWGITAGKSSPTATEIDTFWVTDIDDRKIYAYGFDGIRKPELDIDLEQLDIINQQQYYYGLAATETIMYVAEFITGRVYAFSMPGVSGRIGPALTSSDATLSDLSLTDVSPDVSASFDSRQTVYFGSVDHDVTSTTVTARVNHPSAKGYQVKYGPTEIVAENGVVPLATYGDHVIKVVVTAQDDKTKTYTVTVTRPEPSDDATLYDLSLSGVNLGITPGSVADRYSATVDNSLTETTVMATPNDADVTSVVINHNGNYVDGDNQKDVNGDHVVGQHVVSLGAETLDPNDVDGNTITVEVTAQDGTTKTYTVEVTRKRAKSDVAKLRNLILQYENSEDTVALDREFDGTDTENTRYTASVGHGASTVMVKPETEDKLATVQIREGGAETNGVVANERTLQDSDNGAVPLEVGANTVTVEVTAEDGVTMIAYVVTITRAQPSNVATLQSLSLDPGELSPTFSSGTGRYTAAVLHDDDSIDLTYIKSNGTAKVVTKVGGTVASDNTVVDQTGTVLHTSEPNTNNSETVTVPMASVGSYTVTLELTAQDQTTTGLYVVTVTRPEEPASDDATLGSLRLEKAADAVEVKLDSPLADDDIFYEAEVGNAVTSIKIFAEPTDPDVQSIELQVGGVTDNTADKATLEAGHTVSLSEGTTILTLIVTAQDGNDKTYTIHVVRLERPLPGTAILAELVLKDVAQAELTLDPVFVRDGEPGQDPYATSVDNGVNRVHVTATATDTLATVEVMVGGTEQDGTITGATDADSEGFVALAVAGGDNTVRVVVTAQDGSKLIYEITVTRAAAPASDVATLSSLTVSDAPFTFVSDTLSYTVGVGNGVTSTTVRAIATSEAASLTVTLGSATATSNTDVKLTAPLKEGDNVIKVVVTPEDQQEIAEDQRMTETYTITVTRASSNPGTSNPGTSNPGTSNTPTFNTGSSNPGGGSGTPDTSDTDSEDSDDGSGNTGSSNPGGGSGTPDTSDTDSEDSDDGSGNTGSSNPGGGSGTPDTSDTDSEDSDDGSGNTGSSNPGGGSGTPDTSDTDSEDSDDGSGEESPYSDGGDGGTEQEEAINALYGLGVLTGTECEANRICPNDPLTRWLAAVWLVRILDGEEPPAITESRFADVNASPMWEESMWFAPHVERLAELGVTIGCSVTAPARYCPDEGLTRAQVASWIERAFDLSSAASAGFSDTADNTHEPDIDSVVAAGIMSGCSTNPDRFCPRTVVTRGEMALYVDRARKLASGS